MMSSGFEGETMSVRNNMLKSMIVGVSTAAGMCSGMMAAAHIVVRFGWAERDTMIAGCMLGMLLFGSVSAWIVEQ